MRLRTNEDVALGTLLRRLEKAEEPVLNSVLFLTYIKKGEKDKAVDLLRSCPAVVPRVMEISWVWSEQYYDLIDVLAKTLALENKPNSELMKGLVKALESGDKRTVIIALKVLGEASDSFSEELTAIKIPEAIPSIVGRLKDNGKIKMEALITLSHAAYSGTDIAHHLREIARATTVRLDEEGGSKDAAFDKVHSIMRSAIEKGDRETAMNHVQEMLSSKRETDVLLALETIASLAGDTVEVNAFAIDYDRFFTDKRVRVRCAAANVVQSLAEKKVAVAETIPHLEQMFLHPKETLQDVCELDQVTAGAEALEQLIKIELMQELVLKIAVKALLGEENHTAFHGMRILHHEQIYADVSWVSPEVLNLIIREVFTHNHADTINDILVWIGTGRPEMTAQIQKIVDEHPNRDIVKLTENVFKRIEAANAK